MNKEEFVSQEKATDLLKEYSITPLGIIFSALGGYVGESNGLRTKENSQKVENEMAKYMEEAQFCLYPKDGRLYFYRHWKKKKWWQIFG